MNWSTSWSNPSVSLPQAKAGEKIIITNNGDTPSTIYPPSSKQTNPLDALNQDQLLMKHKKLQDDLAALKAEELELRKYIVNRAFPNKTEGTNTLELGNGYELKTVVKYNYKLADNDTVEKALDRLASIGNSGRFVADRLVGWTPNFYVSEYREIQKSAEEGSNEAKEMLKIVTEFLTITDATPTLSIKEPKAKK